MKQGVDINLSQEQNNVLDAVLRGRSVFLTGSAGTGKSATINQVTKKSREKHGNDHVAVVVSTGIAGSHINGTTIHAFSGAGTLESSLAACVTMAQGNGAGKRWKNTDVLIIDECSMLSADLFDKLEKMANRMRSHIKNMPFGGMQLIVTGDFFQLPPVSRDPNWKYAFESEAWKKCNLQSFVLTQIFRQNHEEFVQMLQKLRVGIVDQQTDTILKNICKLSPTSDKKLIKPTHLYCTRNVVDGENDRELNKIMNVPLHTFNARDRGQKSKLGKNMLVPETLRLKKGAQVLLLKNLNPPHLVNGSRGVVIDFEAGEMEGNIGGILYPVIQFKNGIKKLIRPESFKVESGGSTIAERIQVPLALAWALTIHKSQGMTLDSAVMDISRAFGPGQAYVALSRCTSLNEITLTGYDRSKIFADERVLKFYAELGDPMAKLALETEPTQKRSKFVPNNNNPVEKFYKPKSRPSLSNILEEDL